ncbi:autophagy protein 16 [Saccharata proteae CBS 121410]|uniref:Autophagy protein 16 n=1 Tax=Saccharata proteae CBS 121410 TaxID=1314787 RepID=A0A9P4HV30_9PEZI|nr:autophagy protein 16 [Saccharata proteae CBS 121410]
MSWLAEYISALHARDKREKAQESTINAFTKLADRTARLEAQAAVPPLSSQPSSPNPGLKGKGPLARGSTASPINVAGDATGPQDLLNRLRTDLANSQSSRANLKAEVDSLNSDLRVLKTKSATDSRTIADLTRKATILERKLKDRESEIKEKGRLVEDLQDELVSLNLQFNMAEQKAEKAEKENREILERYLARVKMEAEEMNDDNENQR